MQLGWTYIPESFGYFFLSIFFSTYTILLIGEIMPMKWRTYVLPICIFFIAFFVRLGILFSLPANQDIFSKYLTLAQQLIDNSFLTPSPFSYSPIYCYFLAFIIAIFGKSYYAIFIVQSILGACSCILIFWLAQKLLGRKTALFCAFLAIVYRSFIIYDLSFLSDSLGMLLHLLALCFAYKAWETQKYIYCGLLGFILGCTIIQRPNNLLLIVLLFIAGLFYQRNIFLWHWKKIAISIVVFLLPILPIVIQNYPFLHEPGITASNPGYIFYSSHNYKNQGLGYHPPELLYHYEVKKMKEGKEEKILFEGDVELSRELSSHIVGKEQTIPESSQFYWKITFQSFYKYPKAALKLFLQKIWWIFHSYENHDTIPTKLRAERISPFLPFSWFWIAPFCVVGLFLSKREWKKWLPMYWIFFSQCILLIAFYVVVRFRLSVEALGILFTGLTVRTLYECFQNRQKSILPLLVSCIAIVAFLCNIGNKSMIEYIHNNELNIHYQYARMAFQQKDYVTAFEYFEKIISREKPYTKIAIKSQYHIATMWKIIGKEKESQEIFQKINVPLFFIIRELDSQYQQKRLSFENTIYLGNSYEETKQYASAILIYLDLLQQAPENAFVRYSLANVYRLSQQNEKAIEEYKQAIQDGILFCEEGLYACFYVAELLEAKGDQEQAKQYYIQARRQSTLLDWYLNRNPEEEQMILQKLSEKNF